MTERLTWLGHATVLIELGEAALVTDPVLRRRVAHLRRRTPAPRAPPRLDAVLISHLHRDHLDLPSLKLLDPSAPVVVPRGGARVVRRSGREVIELSPGEALELAGIRIRAVPATHDGRRSPLSRRAEAVGYVVEGQRRVYFAGDTERFLEMADLVDLDAALLPIWGWGPRLGPGHMDPEEAAEAVALMQPRLVVPIHWGTFRPVGPAGRRARLPCDPAVRFAARVAAAAPGVVVRVLTPGESTCVHPCCGRRAPTNVAP
jgi:L-ascorbate metabolism protein UlaG (beta-lactamase superfamily)